MNIHTKMRSLVARRNLIAGSKELGQEAPKTESFLSRFTKPLLSLSFLALAAPSAFASTDYCDAAVSHFNIEAEVASAVSLTIEAVDSNSVDVSVTSANDDPVDLMIIGGQTNPAAVGATTITDGTATLRMTWNDGAPATTSFEVLWSKESMGGNWMLRQSDLPTINTAANCGGSGSTDGGSTDGGSTDGGSTDGGSTDGGSTDGSTPAAPRGAAPTPTHAAGQVLSIFSDAYTSLEGVDFNPNWGQSTVVTNADGELTYAGLNYQGTGFTAQDVSGYKFLHVDFYTDDSTALNFYLITGAAEVAIPLTITAGQWNSVDIPLSSFNGNLANAYQFKVDGNGTVVLDNLYFHTLVAPTPTLPEADVLSIFSDAYTDVADTNFNPGWGQATQVSTDNGVLTYTGLNYQGTEFVAAQDVSGYAYLHVDFYTENSTDLGIFLIGGGTEVEYLFDLDQNLNQWNSVDIPLTAFSGVDLTNVIQFKVDGNGDIQFDNLYFHGDPNAAPRGAAPTPTAAESGVISIYSDAYSNVAGTEFNPGWGQATQVTNENGELTYANFNYQGTVLGSAQDVSGYGYLHIDYYSDDFTSLEFFLISTGKETPYALTATTGQWNSVDIPLADYAGVVDLTDVIQFKAVGNGTVVLDNLYFHGKPAAPAPTLSDSRVLSIYSDAYTDVADTDFNPNWGQSTVVTNALGELTYSNLNYQGTTLGSSQDVTGYENLHVDFYTDDAAALNVKLISTGPVEVGYDFAITAGQWNSVDIPLTEFEGVDLADVIQLSFTGSAGSTVRLDNLYFWNTPASEYCDAPVTHFANDGGAALLTIANVDANSIKVSLTSSDENAVNAINVTGAAGHTFTDSTVGDALVRTLTWADGAPDNVSLNVQWGKEGMPGMVMLSETDISVPSAAICTEETAATYVLTAYDATSVSMAYGNTSEVAVDNGDGTWTVVIDPASDASFNYNWVVDGTTEDLLFAAIAGECADDITAGTVYSDGYSEAYRVSDGSVGTTNDRYNSCAGTVNGTNFTVVAANASSVKLNSSRNNWIADDALVATDNGDGSWTVNIDPSPDTFEYLWIVGQNSENLADNYSAGECDAEVAGAELVVDGSDVTRQWVSGSGDASDTYEACAATPTTINPVVIDNGVVSRFYNRGLLAFDGVWGWNQGDCDPLIPNTTSADMDCVSVEVTVENDADRGDVMQVAFTDTNAIGAGVFAGIQGKTDFSDYIGGSITFDIKNVSGDTGLTYKIDSDGTLTPKSIASVGANGWETVTISVNELISSGLDIETVTTGFVFWSTVQPSTFQIDNLQWNTGNEGEIQLPQVTFKVDMSAETVHADGVYIAGGGFGQAGHLMSDEGGGIWSITLEMPKNAQATYKFRNRSAQGNWDGFESPAGLAGCGVGQYTDRYVDVVEDDIVLDVVAYGSCTAQPYEPPVGPSRPAAPVPTDDAQSVLSVFGTTYGNLVGTDFNPGWGQATAVVVDTDLEYSNLNYQGTAFAAQDVSGYEYLNVDYYVTQSTALNFFLIGGGETSYALDVSTVDQWVSVQIPLSAYSDVVNLGAVHQFKVDGNGTVAFNNLYFGGTAAPADTTAPVITLNGDAEVTVALDGSYTDAGATADTGETVSVSGTVDTSTEGTYTLTYSATDEAGNVATPVSRTVTVADLPDTDGDGTIDSIDTDDDNDGIPDTLETETGRDPLALDYQVGVGKDFSCALESNSVTCWGKAQYGQLNAPELSNPTQLAVGKQHSCVIDDTGVVCWGRDQFGETVPPVLSNPTEVAAGKDHSCAIDDTGVVCWGRNNHKQTNIPSEISNPYNLSSTVDHTCVLDDNGAVCWGNWRNSRKKVPKRIVAPTDISAGAIHTCVIDQNAVDCFGYNGNGRATPPEGLVNPRQVSAGGTFSCALDDNGVTCWGKNNLGQTDVPSLDNPSQVFVGVDHACAVDSLGVTCWGANWSGKSVVPALDLVTDHDSDGIADAVEIASGTNRFNADSDGDGADDGADFAPLDSSETTDFDGDGIGNNADTDDDNDGVPDVLENETGRDSLRLDYQVGVGTDFSCALETGNVVCWGKQQYGQLNVPVLSNPTQLAVGKQHTCVIEDSGVVCWGRDQYGETVPPVLSNPVALTSGKDHTCAIDDTGVVCWGRNNYKQQNIPSSISNPTQISATIDHTCAIDDSGVVCWGNRKTNRLSVPGSLSNPTDVSAGALHSCAIDDSGAVCWGYNSNGRATPPDTLVNPRQIAAGGSFSCALDDNGVTCWGRNNVKQTEVPELVNPVQVFAGVDHACAVDSTGVVCWGANWHGKRNAPVINMVRDNDGDGVDDAEDSAPYDISVQ